MNSRFIVSHRRRKREREREKIQKQKKNRSGARIGTNCTVRSIDILARVNCSLITLLSTDNTTDSFSSDFYLFTSHALLPFDSLFSLCSLFSANLVRLCTWLYGFCVVAREITASATGLGFESVSSSSARRESDCATGATSLSPYGPVGFASA